MTLTLRANDVADSLEQIARRLYKIEQLTGSPRVQGVGDATFDITSIDGIPVSSVSSPPTGLVLSTGSFMEDIWIDASWTAPADGNVSGYDVEIARKVSGVYQTQQVYRVGGTSIRIAALEPQTTYGVRVQTINRIGVRSSYLPSSGFTDITSGIDASIPAQVTGVSISAGFKTVTITWTEVADRDVARGSGQYLVELATNSGFTTGYQSKFVTGTIASFTNLTTGTTYFARVTAIDNSGNSGAVSLTVSATTSQVTQPDLANLSVGTAQIIDASIVNAKIGSLAVDDAKIADLSATKINAGTLNAARIAANSLDVEKLTSSNMSTVNLTITGSGAIKAGNPPTTGLLINSQGLRLYNAGAATVILDAVSGAGTFKGNIDASTITASTISGTNINGGTITGVAINGNTIDGVTITGTNINGGTITGATVRTASSGQRVAFEAGVISKLKFYTGNNQENGPGEANVGVSGSRLELGIYAPKIASQYYSGVQFFSTNTVGGIGGIQLQVLDAAGANKGRIFMTGSATQGSICDIADWNLARVWVDDTRYEFKEYNSGSAVLSLHSPNGSSASMVVFNGSGNKILVGNGAGSATAAIEATSFDVASSVHGKDLLTDPPKIGSKLDQLKVVRFKRKNKDNQGKLEDPNTYWGFIAEEVVNIFPEAVLTGEDGNPSAISLSTIVAILVKRVQELSMV